MFNSIFGNFFGIGTIFIRTIRAFFVRNIFNATNKVKRVTDITRQVSTRVPKLLFGVPAMMKAPEKREDYIETKGFFISKSMLFFMVAGIIAFCALTYFVVLPFLISHFFTASFYEKDKKVADYSGKVYLYYDIQKKQKSFEGRLEKGVIQGSGTEYDENKNVLYDGEYKDGAKIRGKAYVDSKLRYSGDFSDNTYSGEGTEYYDSGKIKYVGGFVGGLYNGAGTEYYEKGTKKYDGTFSKNLYNGAGTEYFSDGTVKYSGSFVDSVWSGNGTLYNNKGVLVYKGGFDGGIYQGAGMYYIDAKTTVSADFDKGMPKGEINISVDGFTAYEGASTGLEPNGFGKLYELETDNVIYSGAMKDGKPDIQSVIGRTYDDAKGMFGNSKLNEALSGDKYFSVTNNDLGIKMLVSFKTEQSDPIVITANMYEAKLNFFNKDLTWIDSGVYGEMPDIVTSGAGKPADTVVAGTDTAVTLPNLPDGIVGENSSVSGAAGGVTTSPTMQNAVSLPIMGGGKTKDRPITKDDTAKTADTSDPDGIVFKKNADTSEIVLIMNSMVDFAEYAEKQKILGIQSELLNEQTKRESSKISMGGGNQKTLDDLNARIKTDKNESDKCTIRIKSVQTAVSDIADIDFASLDLSKVMFTFAPDDIDKLNILDDKSDVKQIDLDILALQEAYLNITSATDVYNSAVTALQNVNSDYKLGKADDTAIFSAKMAVTDAYISLYSNICSYTKDAVTLNFNCGGKLGINYNWLSNLNSRLATELAAPSGDDEVSSEENTVSSSISHASSVGGADTPSVSPNLRERDMYDLEDLPPVVFTEVS
ncbi:hypothetical protein FACS1894133_1770 [Clostridia bacterium]|nr:hypothetical protein FACS1894133_1770 [Clostridia bacterium]